MSSITAVKGMPMRNHWAKLTETPTTIISTIYKSEVSMLPMVSQAYRVETVMARA